MQRSAEDLDRSWFKRFGATGHPAHTRLLCFHHAGGSAAMYRRWGGLLPDTIETIGVQLPGRADRFVEPPHAQMIPLVDDLVDAVGPLLERPFAFFGISMGARVAWALAHELRDRALPSPVRLHLACDAAPSTDDGTWPWEDRADGIEGYMREMGGTPTEVLDQPELMRALVPTLRCDLAVLSTHSLRPDVPLDVPVVAYAGVHDPVAPPARVAQWRQETTAGFVLHRLESGHFLDTVAEETVISTIASDLG
jgi:medium-chain acyl-[acyl-carrier-protein] hydrolase